MQSSFKQELEEEILDGRKQRLVNLTLAGFIVVVLFGAILFFSKDERGKSDQQDIATAELSEKPGDKDDIKTDKPPDPNEDLNVPDEAARSTQRTQTAPHSTPPATSSQSIDRASFISTGRLIVSRYDQIVGLVTFGPSTSTEEKIARIKQAYAIDKQYSGSASELRGIVLKASSPDSMYLGLVNMEEEGVAAISVGVYSMNQWATSPSDNYSMASGEYMIAKGANLLLQFSRKLDSI